MNNMKKRVLVILGILVLLWAFCYYYATQVTDMIHGSMVTRSIEMTEDAAHVLQARLVKNSSEAQVVALKKQLNDAKLFGVRGRMHLVDEAGKEVFPNPLQRPFTCEQVLPSIKEKFPALQDDSFLTRQEYVGVYNLDRAQYCFAYAPVGVNNWYVVALVPLDVAFYYEQQALRLTVALIIAMVLILSIIAAYIIYESKTKKRELYKMAYGDDITRLGNKNMFFAAIAEIAKKKNDDIWCLLIFDIHNFKWVNDSFGIATGNKVLAEIGQLIAQEYLSSDEIAVRLTADDFLILKPMSTWQEPKAYAESLLHRIGTLAIEGRKLNLKAFAGGVMFRSASLQDGHLVLDAAVKAGKEAAKQLENPLVFYNEDMIAKEKEDNALLEDLKQDVEGGKLKVFYQPKYNPRTGKIIGAEALVRWQHATRGYVSPGAFIPLAENKGLVWDVTKVVFAKVCSDLAQWRQQGLKLVPISVNLSTHDLFQEELFAYLLENLNKYGIRAEELELEVTETGIMHDLPLALKLLRKLKSLGFKLDIDDFGTGYSALSYLQEGVFDIIKLDRSFVLQRDKFKAEGEKLITSVLALGKNLGLTCICEGAETKEQVDFLTAAGCDGIQGFYFAKPMPEEDFKKLL